MDFREAGCPTVKILFMMDQMAANMGELISHLMSIYLFCQCFASSALGCEEFI